MDCSVSTQASSTGLLPCLAERSLFSSANNLLIGIGKRLHFSVATLSPEHCALPGVNVAQHSPCAVHSWVIRTNTRLQNCHQGMAPWVLWNRTKRDICMWLYRAQALWTSSLGMISPIFRSLWVLSRHITFLLHRGRESLGLEMCSNTKSLQFLGCTTPRTRVLFVFQCWCSASWRQSLEIILNIPLISKEK